MTAIDFKISAPQSTILQSAIRFLGNLGGWEHIERSWLAQDIHSLSHIAIFPLHREHILSVLWVFSLIHGGRVRLYSAMAYDPHLL